MLHIFLCVCWPSVPLLWRHVCLGLPPTFWLDCLLFWYWAVCVASIFCTLIPWQLFSFAIIFSHPEGCLFILFIVSFAVHKILSLIMCSVTQSCLALCNPLDCSPQGFSVHGISQTIILGVGCHFLLQGIFPAQGSNGNLLCLQPWQADSFPLCNLGSPIIFLNIAYWQLSGEHAPIVHQVVLVFTGTYCLDNLWPHTFIVAWSLS